MQRNLLIDFGGKVILSHRFVKKYKLNFSKIDTLDEFSSFIIKESIKQVPVVMTLSKKDGEHDANLNNRMTFLGEAFETLIECLILCNPTTWVSNYTPNFDFDKGVDGFGIGMNGRPATIQIKFRSDPTVSISQEVLYSFVLYSLCNMDDMSRRVDIEDMRNMFVFTNCKSIDYRLASHCGDRVAAVTGKNIKYFIDHNNLFWKEFNENFI
jgi:hypothetical protein